MGSTVKLEDKSLKALIKRMQQLDGTVVEVGFFEEDRYGPENNNLPVAMVAFLNEYGHSLGIQGVPERPFMHETFGDRMSQLHITNEIKKVFISAITDGRSVQRMLRQAGHTIASLIEVAIDDYPGSNSPTTIKRKGFNDPLRDTGKMLNSVRFEVHYGGRK